MDQKVERLRKLRRKEERRVEVVVPAVVAAAARAAEGNAEEAVAREGVEAAAGGVPRNVGNGGRGLTLRSEPGDAAAVAGVVDNAVTGLVANCEKWGERE